MKLGKQRKEDLLEYIIYNVDQFPSGIVTAAANVFKISRQSVRAYINQLINEGVLEKSGVKRATRYSLRKHEFEFPEQVTKSFDETKFWVRKIMPVMPSVRDNVLGLCQYGVTEMLNNVVDHSDSSHVIVRLDYTAKLITFHIIDFGVGIFTKVQQAFSLQEKHDAIFELCKGKLTTDPENHSGEGIFFTSRMFDRFNILSEGLFFSGHDNNDWLVEHNHYLNGTYVLMSIYTNTERTESEVFNKYSSAEEDGESGFSKTHLTLKAMLHESGRLVSRSQAKRLVARFGKFKEVVLDFNEVAMIGQGFADQVFRVFQQTHPEVKLTVINDTPEVQYMIKHVQRDRKQLEFDL